MKYVTLGDSDLRVSAACLGGAGFGTQATDEPTFHQLDKFFELGGTFVDSANMYSWWVKTAGAGCSESSLGRWMKARGNRDKVVVATKMGMPHPAFAGSAMNAPTAAVEKGLRRAQIIEECDKSLRRLQTDHIDLYYTHADDRTTPIEETMAGFEVVVRTGKVRQIAVSNFAAWRIAQSNAVARTRAFPRYVAVQQHQTYLRPNPGIDWLHNLPGSEELTDFCKSERVTIVAYSPLLMGGYDRPERRWGVGWLPSPDRERAYGGPDADARLATLESVAKEIGVTNSQLVLAWMVNSTPPVVPLFGASSDAQLAMNMAAIDIKLMPEQMARLNK
ncbi:MAG: aldo/keto reductase [Planctomycetes bacterium]|nr:aldo/keto reductase [Planctomycetota bacterium]